MGGGRLGATIHLVCPLVQKGGTHEHLKFAQLPFEEMGGTPIEHIAMQYPLQPACQMLFRSDYFC